MRLLTNEWFALPFPSVLRTLTTAICNAQRSSKRTIVPHHQSGTARRGFGGQYER